MNRIPVAGPWITAKEVEYVADAAATGWYGNANAYTDRFEKAFAAYTGTRYAVSLPSCTSAIHLSLLALGVGPGDEVVVPDVTWIASVAPVSYVGATAVFADMDADTWCLSASSFEACITPKTRAVIPVDLYGNIPDMDAIRKVASARGIAVIEDAAEAVGAEYKGRRAGGLGDTGVFSFHGTKTLTTGEGGMLVTDREDVLRRVHVLRDHGRHPGDKSFTNAEVAYKYKMSGLQAALGLAQLERVGELIERKRQIFGWYSDRLPDLVLNTPGPDVASSYWMVTAILDGVEKYRLIEQLAAEGIDSRPFFNPLSSLAAFAGSVEAERARERNRVSYQIAPFGINLPSALSLTEDDVARVCRALRACLSRSGSAAA